jgi:protein pelota
MKVVSYDGKRGMMKVIPENIDDLWVLYNVTHMGDRVYARSTRLVKVEEEAARPTKGRRVSMFLGVRVEKISFQRESDRLRVNGLVIEAPERFGIKGSYHTIKIPIGRPVTISKEMWLRHDLERIKRAGEGATVPIIVVSIDGDEGCVALLRHHGVDVKAEIRARLPGKREAEKREMAVSRYFKSILKALAQIWEDTNGLIAVIGPGFLKKNFTKYARREHPEIFSAIKAVRTVGSGGISGVKEAVRSGVLDKVAKEVRIIEESKAVNEVLSRLASQRERASYGLINVEKAINNGAVEVLLVADRLLREADDGERARFEGLMRRVEEMGGSVMIINAEHESGEQLVGLGGMAALLRFSVT